MKEKVYSMLIGAGSSVIMALCVIQGMNLSGYRIGSAAFCVECLIAFLFPYLLDGIRKRGFYPVLAQGMMVLFSFAIVLFYANYVTNPAGYIVANNGMTQRIILYSCILHAFALLGILVFFLVRRKK